MRGRIKRLRVKNLLSLRDVTIDFGEQLTVLVGPNAGGKSNIIKTLEILKKIFEEPGTSIINKDIHLSEILYGKRYKEAYITLHGEIYNEDVGVNVKLTEKEVKWELFTSREPGELGLEVKFLRFILGMGFYSFIPQLMLKEVEMVDEPILLRDGSNFAGLLAYLKLTNSKLFHNIEEIMRSYIPEIEEIVISPKTIKEKIGSRVTITSKVYRICVKESKFEEPFTTISDGTLRLLGFVTALSLNHSLVAFEEPENCIHPHLLELLVDMMRKADCQVVITTHSPYLLDYVEPEEVVVVWREMGEEGLETKVRRPSEEELERVKALLRDGWTLGEVWCSGVIGGVPE